MSAAGLGVIGVVALLFFWAVGAWNRLNALRQAVLAAFAPLAAALAARRAAVRAWLDSADLAAGLSPGLPDAGGEADPPDAGALARAQAVAAVRHAAAQAHAAAQDAATRPLAAGGLSSLSLAEQVFERSLSTLVQPGDAPVLPEGWVLPQAVASAELDLAMARQAFNAACADYNRAIAQIPASWLAAIAGLRPMATLRAGPSLGVSASALAASGSAAPAPVAG
jgi:LemA protein